MQYTDSLGTICTNYVDHPQVVSILFAASNDIDTHSQLHQDSLKLKKRLILSSWFGLTTTLIGVTVTDKFLLCNYHKVNSKKKYNSEFLGILAHQLIQMAHKREADNNSIFLL